MPTFGIGGVTFDTGATPAPVNHGYTKAQRDALTDDTLIKVHDLATKSNLDAKLTKGLQVTTFNPTDLKDSSNFFNFVSQWEAVILQIETHLKTYFMESPFTLAQEEITAVTAVERRDYEFRLTAFLAASAANNGNAQSYVDATNATNVTRPVEPQGTTRITEGGFILRDWHNMSLNEVAKSVTLFNRFVDDATHRQNLVWSFKFIMDCLDADLKTFVLSKISSMPPEVGRTGPVAFMIVAQRILQTTENLAQKVINGFIALRLTHFDSENVVEAIFTVRNVLKFLRYGEPNTFAPRTTITLIYDVFRGASVGAFRAHAQQAQDIVLQGVTDPETIFDHFQTKYEELLLADRWVAMTKRKSAFVLGGDGDKTKTCVEHDKDKKPDDDTRKEKGMKKRPTHDKSGRKIDYTPPKPGESHERTRDGQKEYWCGVCGRWGSHLTNKHDEWRKNFNKNKKKKEGDGNAGANAGSSPPPPSGGSRGAVTFAAAVSGNANLAVDPELADGIDF